jgi:hypothetical protein
MLKNERKSMSLFVGMKGSLIVSLERRMELCSGRLQSDASQVPNPASQHEFNFTSPFNVVQCFYSAYSSIESEFGRLECIWQVLVRIITHVRPF